MKTIIHFIKAGLAVVLVIICAFCSLSGLSQNWTGNVNSDWNNSANWSAWPLSNASVIINPVNYTGASATPVISVNSSFVPNNVSVINGGSLNIQANVIINNNLSINQGGSVSVETGTIYIGQNLVIANGNGSSSSQLTMEGGQLDIFENIVLENTSGNYNPAFNLNSGIVTVDGNVTWGGQSPGAGAPKFCVNGGVANLKGDLLNLPSSTVKLYTAVSSGTLNYSGDFIKTINASDSIKQVYPGRFIFSDSTEWENNGIFYSDSALTEFNGYTKLLGTGDFKFHHLFIQSLQTLDFVAPMHINIHGNYTNNGTFKAYNNSVIFTGTQPQFIGGASSSTFAVLVSNNTSAQGITLNQSLTISEAMALFSGKLNTSAANLLIFLDGSTSTPGSATSFVNGPVKKIGNDVFDFPIGKNNQWGRVTMAAPLSLASELTVEYFDAAYTNTSSVNAPLLSVSDVEYWSVAKTNPLDSIDFSLYWQDAAASHITSCSGLTMAHWNGAQWDDITSTYSGTCSGNGTGFVKAAGMHGNNGVFTFGFTDVVTGIKNNVLPASVEIYPNPNYGRATIKFNENYSKASFKLMDLTGKVIMENKELKSETYELDYTSYPAGVYFIEIKQDKVVYATKIIKL